MISLILGLVIAAQGSPPTFHCDTKTVPLAWRCNDLLQCLGNEDERDCEVFDCQDHHPGQETIPVGWKCDANVDCKNGRDQENCPEQFQCQKEGEFILAAYECDHYVDCSDGSDEAHCDKFQCGDESQTRLPEVQQCNGFVDCPNRADEEDCPLRCCPGSDSCEVEEMLSLVQLCDDVQDCRDGSDLGGDFCPFYKCNGERNVVVDKSRICDNNPDCPEKEDENEATCQGEFHDCDVHEIPMRNRCDGVNQCLNNNDENSPECRGPVNQQFKCKISGDKEIRLKSVKFTSVCDGIRDCPMGDDEEVCFFKCDLTIYGDWRCDGVAECSDGSDELDC
jgi:hypothetical protein